MGAGAIKAAEEETSDWSDEDTHHVKSGSFMPRLSLLCGEDAEEEGTASVVSGEKSVFSAGTNANKSTSPGMQLKREVRKTSVSSRGPPGPPPGPPPSRKHLKDRADYTQLHRNSRDNDQEVKEFAQEEEVTNEKIKSTSFEQCGDLIDDDDDDESDVDGEEEEVYDWCAFDTMQALGPKEEEVKAESASKLVQSKSKPPPPKLIKSPVVTPSFQKPRGPPQAIRKPTTPVTFVGRMPGTPGSKPGSATKRSSSISPHARPPLRSPAQSQQQRQSPCAVESVKETHDVTRKRASLPSSLQHPMPTSGDFLKKRVVVNNYLLLDSLGSGSYAEVKLCKEKNTDVLYALKILNKDVLRRRLVFPSKEQEPSATASTSGADSVSSATAAAAPSSMLDDVKREIAIMKKLSHPHVLRLYEVMDDPKVNKLYLVLEYMRGGDLMNMLKGDSKSWRCETMNETALWHVFRQVACGLEYLHLQNIIHGDMKPANLLVSEDGLVKIADFGISKMLEPGVRVEEQKLVETAGTPAFQCPEICAGVSYSGAAADVWAFGGTMYMLRFGRPPFLAQKLLQLYYQIIHESLELPPNEIVSREACDPNLIALLASMLTKEPEKRASLKAVLAHPWLRAVPRHNKFATSPSPPPPSIPPKNNVLSAYRPAAGGPPPMQKGQQIIVTKNEMRSAISRRPESGADRGHRRLNDGEEQRRIASFVQKQSRSVMRTSNSTNLKSSDSPRPSSSKSSATRQESDVGHRGGDNCGDQDELTVAACEEDLDDVFRGVLLASSRGVEEPAPLDHLYPLSTPLSAPPTLCSAEAKIMAAWHSRRGQRPTQEDRVTVIPEMSALDTVLGRGTAYVAVFDGHDGTKCVDFLQHELHTYLATRPDFCTDVRQALIGAFLEADEKVTKILEDESGSTALVALVDGPRQQLIIAHAGDSKCVLSTSTGLALSLTSDHRLTTRPDEVRRIKAAGGVIVNSRLNGTLAVSRAFGDLPHKSTAGPPTVTAAPEITIRNLDPQDEFILLASDGLFDVVSMQAAVNFVRVELNRHHNLQNAARNLTAEALRRGSIDNVSVVLLAFQDPNKLAPVADDPTTASNLLRHQHQDSDSRRRSSFASHASSFSSSQASSHVAAVVGTSS